MDDRIEWINAAWGALPPSPDDILERACNAAALVCDHPAKLVPFIAKEIGEWPSNRERELRYAESALANFDNPKLAAPKQQEVKPDLGPITQEEINSLPLFLRQSWLNLNMITQAQFDAAWSAHPPPSI